MIKERHNFLLNFIRDYFVGSFEPLIMKDKGDTIYDYVAQLYRESRNHFTDKEKIKNLIKKALDDYNYKGKTHFVYPEEETPVNELEKLAA